MAKCVLLITLLASVGAATSLKKPQAEDVSDVEHYGDAHNTQYDHDAFLGKDEARTYDGLTPRESKEKLGVLFHKVDADGDGQVSADELHTWMVAAQSRYALQEAEQNMKQFDANGDGNVTWVEYKNSAYGFLNKNGIPKGNVDHDEYPKYNKAENGTEYYKKQIDRDERRYTAADINGDKLLNRDELATFFNPEAYVHMRGVAAVEALEYMDKDGDNLISWNEFRADVSPDEGEGEDERDWVTEEKKHFTEVYDKNKDGKLNVDELKDWIFPAEEDYARAEANHLISESDRDRDGTISKEEMLDNHDLFVGSQATDYGELLNEEL